MRKLTRTRLHRHLDGAIEILRPEVTGPYAIEIVMALLMLKRASDQMVTGAPEIIERAVTIEIEERDRLHVQAPFSRTDAAWGRAGANPPPDPRSLAAPP